ncbi:MAG TPA: hypothetical protein VG966_07165 [Hyphomicrobiaceae bacterium]|jgi:hypothetical protein|nr:hypothetical protein [Hyphomicrobiaceae bacterium]
MPEPHFATADDDLPRTFRREREAREREAREREEREREMREQEEAEDLRVYLDRHRAYGSAAPEAGAVSRLEIPFFHLMRFFIKAVFAAIPALILLSALLWLGGQGLSIFFPHLSKMQILIHFPK